MMTYKPKPDKFDLGDLPKKIEGGDITIPQFQRQFVWSVDNCARLFDSIFKGYPIGTVTLWTTQERMRHVKEIAGHKFPEAKVGYPVNYALDGQQRLTSIYVGLRGEKVDNGDGVVDCGKLYLKLDVTNKEEDLVVTDVTDLEDDAYVSIRDLYDLDYNKLHARFGPKYANVVEWNKLLVSYPIPTIELSGASLLEATEIFTRINTTGKRLSVFEVVCARVYRETPPFDLVEKRNQQIDDWENSGFETLPDYVTLQALALVLHASCTKNTVLKLTCDEVANNWDKLNDAFGYAIDYLRQSFHIPAADLMPYDVLIIPFVYFMFNNGCKKPTLEQEKWIKDYFWRTALTQRFSNAVASKLTQDVAYFDAVLSGAVPSKDHLHPVSITPKKIVADGAFNVGSAFIKAILCLFASQQPKSFLNNGNVVVDNSWVSKKNAKNYHHFFPRAYMKKKGWDESICKVDHIANIVIIDSADNQSVKDADPAKYISGFQRLNPGLSATLKTHLIDGVSDFGIDANDYEKFFKMRVSRICEELQKCIVPRPEDELAK